jgi:5-oxoprolinase (ATP-hydrolysing)
MTNTRIGDLELLEIRFPAILREFSIRRGTGGAGNFKGGDGIRRVYEARVPMEASHDGQRRVIAPHGVHGGSDGERGASYLRVKKLAGGTRIVKLKPAAQVKWVHSSRTLSLRSLTTIRLQAGEQLIVHTAGAGGWGKPGSESVVETTAGGSLPRATRANGSVSLYTQAEAECD